jgi:DnaK suppressor protein
MSKSTAKSTRPPNKAVKKPATAVKKPAAKAASKPAKKAAKPSKPAKPVAKSAPRAAAKPAKTTAKRGAAPVTKASTKQTVRPVAKAAGRAAGKPAARPAPKPPAKVPAKPVAPSTAKSTAKAVAASSTTRSMPPASAKPAPVVVKPLSPARSAAAAGKAAAAAAALAAAAAASAAAASAASASRFADRFAPPKPTARTVTDHSLDAHKPVAKADPKLAGAWKHKSGRELSEAELLAMPDSEYMNEKQLEFFRARLAALKDDLLSNAGETTEHLREDTTIVPDPADRATIEEEHALELRTRDRERKLLKKISQSLVRIESGDYGYCDETGEPIGLGRLLARPTATLSLEAQQRREMKQKMFGD